MKLCETFSLLFLYILFSSPPASYANEASHRQFSSIQKLVQKQAERPRKKTACSCVDQAGSGWNSRKQGYQVSFLFLFIIMNIISISCVKVARFPPEIGPDSRPPVVLRHTGECGSSRRDLDIK